MQRIYVHTKDIMAITGKSERQARNIMRQTREKFAKERHQMVTIFELCAALGIGVEEALLVIR